MWIWNILYIIYVYIVIAIHAFGLCQDVLMVYFENFSEIHKFNLNLK